MNFVVVVDLGDSWNLFFRGIEQLTEAYDSVHQARKLAAEFPEVYWIFIIPDESYKQYIPESVYQYHFILKSNIAALYENYLKNVQYGFRVLFDPTGFRDWIRLNSEQDAIVTRLGLSIEDELDYCLFNGYILYKKGYNTFISSTLIIG